MRGSQKPCPGCGGTKAYRKSDEVCTDCKSLLKRAQWMDEQLSKLGDDEVIVAIGQRSHWNAYIHSKSGKGRDLQEIFHRLALSASRPALAYHAEFELLGKIDNGGRMYVKMPRPLAEAIKDLRSAIQPALEAEYEAGKADGHNLLMRLANGDLSVNEYMKKTEAG